MSIMVIIYVSNVPRYSRMYLSEPTIAGLVVGVEAEESAIRVQVKEEIEPKEAAVNKRAGLVNAAEDER